MNKFFRIIITVCLAVFLIAASLSSLTRSGPTAGASQKSIQNKLNQLSPDGVVVASEGGVTKVITDINNLPLRDNPDLYAYDDPGSLVTMYVTVRQGNDLENTNHSWSEVNSATKFFFENMEHVEVPKAEAILQIGDENGPKAGELGYGEMIPNATIQIRGSSTSLRPQKSYKITLFDGAGEWRGQQTISLNKHIFDSTRVRNKLSFDLMQSVPDMVSLRTQFVHLYVRDETSSASGQAYEDYGLFTQIEQPNKKFLKNHLLDRYGQLYKAIMFEFYRYPEAIRLGDDPLYDEAAFSSVMEIKGNKDHTKLIKMLDDVNNWALPIQQTFEQYFDEDNYFTWMAFNILIGNRDTNAQNFYLYSPQNGQKWYFLPWDYDGAFDRRNDIGNSNTSYERGIPTYWGVVLHRRVLSIPEYRERLDQKVEALRAVLTEERVNDLLSAYRPITDRFVDKMPDLLYLPVTLEEYAAAYSLIPSEMELNYQLYRESLESPMPFYLGTPQDNGAAHRFNWDEAYDLQAQDVTYNFEVSTSWDFKNVVSEARLKNVNYVEIPKLQPGVYYWRVVAVNENEKKQIPFDYYVDSNDYMHYGMKYLFIAPSGEIIEKQSE